MTPPPAVLRAEELTVTLAAGRRNGVVVDRLSFELAPGEALAIVGESGCGKSMAALALMGLVPAPVGRVGGRGLWFEGCNLLECGEDQWRSLRGRRIAMVFQEPMTAFNPVLTIGDQIAEAITVHERIGTAAARRRAVELLDSVCIDRPKRWAQEFPHRLSGGMRQRAMIAMALACRPAVLIADEPTTAVDALVRARLLDLLARLRQDFGMAMIIISHDLAMVSRHADRVLVMYAGRKVEEQRGAELLGRPLHPYTRGLIAARPSLATLGRERRRLAEVPGQLPPIGPARTDCAFSPRCPERLALCASTMPPRRTAGDAEVFCHVAPQPIAGEADAP